MRFCAVTGGSEVFRMRIATWNVNSIKQRLDHLAAWLAERNPDIVCLQETKCVDDAFPREAFEALGYNVAIHGQKPSTASPSCRKPRSRTSPPGCPATTATSRPATWRRWSRPPTARVRVASIYLPNGNPPDTEKYPYKIGWMERLIDYARERMALEEPLSWRGTITSFRRRRRPQSVRLGERCAVPAADPARFAPCQSGPHRRDPRRHDSAGPLHVLGLSGRRLAEENGIRIDHVLLSPQATDRFASAGIDKHVRAWEKPSDHVPVVVDLAIEAK